jgi:hypothetical protein
MKPRNYVAKHLHTFNRASVVLSKRFSLLREAELRVEEQNASEEVLDVSKGASDEVLDVSKGASDEASDEASNDEWEE